MLEHLDWDSIGRRRDKIHLVLLYKIINDLVDIPVSAYSIPVSSRTRAVNTQVPAVLDIYRLLQTQLLSENHPILGQSTSNSCQGSLFGILQEKVQHPALLMGIFLQQVHATISKCRGSNYGSMPAWLPKPNWSHGVSDGLLVYSSWVIFLISLFSAFYCHIILNFPALLSLFFTFNLFTFLCALLNYCQSWYFIKFT